jgi:hypothetical protein
MYEKKDHQNDRILPNFYKIIISIKFVLDPELLMTTPLNIQIAKVMLFGNLKIYVFQTLQSS